MKLAVRLNRQVILLTFFAASLAVAPEGFSETASVVGNSRSIQMNVASGYVTGLGPVYTYVTTYDGYPGVSLYEDLPSGVLFSGELRPRVGVSGLYEADFATFDADGYLQDYGSFTANLPTTDSDGNGLPDVAQTNKSGNASVSGTAVSDYYGTVSTISGSLQRPANSSVGTYSVKLTSPGASDITYSGSLYLFSLTGSVDYSRATGVITLTLTEALPQGGSRLITGSTSFVVVNVNQVFLQQFNVSSSDGHNYTVLASTFSRSGNKYISNVALADGLPETSWQDYVNWVVEITDGNDSNGNGIPNLSDDEQTAPTPTPTPTPAGSYTITLIPAPALGGTVAGAGNYNAATLVAVTAIPATGYKFKKWTENGQTLSKTASYTFTAASNRTLTAQFKRKRR
jgi:hypothetical protein